MKTRKLIIVGDSAFAEIAHEYFDAESDYTVLAYSVEAAYLKRHELNDLTVRELEKLCSPDFHFKHVKERFKKVGL